MCCLFVLDDLWLCLEAPLTGELLDFIAAWSSVKSVGRLPMSRLRGGEAHAKLPGGVELMLG